VTQSTADIEQDVLGFLEQHTRKSWTTDTDLFATGGMSSMFALQLVIFLEKRFGVAIDGEDLHLDNFRTVNAMAGLVHRLRGGSAGE